ncbi:hypothetical protein AVEN_123841-1 [Araneus ventricosus]|uniref:Uncharacterized protein n=1 Tax=Araneus ventricosus TaxID=182803 RepID=A0A4Y2JD13_ARAVE|nr:hypothetical protein AVEN_123841-1 [Araneus ventricosus]
MTPLSSTHFSSSGCWKMMQLNWKAALKTTKFNPEGGRKREEGWKQLNLEGGKNGEKQEETTESKGGVRREIAAGGGDSPRYLLYYTGIQKLRTILL